MGQINVAVVRRAAMRIWPNPKVLMCARKLRGHPASHDKRGVINMT
jgi:hypothetical protein